MVSIEIRTILFVFCRIIQRVHDWIDKKEDSGFPLQPISTGCGLSAKRQVEKLQNLLNERFPASVTKTG